MDKIQAKSRLKKPLNKPPAPNPTPAPSRLAKLIKPPRKVKEQNKRLQAYGRYIICLVIAMMSYYGLFFLMSQVYPSQIQHFLWTNSYLPFFTLLFVGNFFLLTFLFLDKKIGFYLAIWLNLVIYLKISQVRLDFYSLGLLLLLAAILLLPDIIRNYANNSNNKR